MIRVGILGAAGIAPQGIVRPVSRRSDMEVVAVASRSAASARRFAKEHGIRRAYEGYAELLADADVDLVYIALPPSEHVGWSIAALEAGKHVLCEKPFSMDAAGARRAAAAAERAGLRLIEAFHDHYHPMIRELQRFLASGELGAISAIKAVFTADNPFSPTSIRHVPELGGGALMDLGCYPVHWLRALGGAEPDVVSARAVLNELGADLVIDATLAFDRGPLVGAEAMLHASMAPGVPFDASIVITGERGQLRAENVVLPHKGHSLTSDVGGVVRSWTVAGRETYDHELDAVARAIGTGEPAATEVSDSVATMEVIDAIYALAGVLRPASPSYLRSN